MVEAGRRALALGAAIAVAAAAGCGGGGDSRLSKAQYEQKMQAEAKSLQTSVSNLGSAVGSLTTLAAKVDTIQKAFTKAASDIDALSPPKDAEADTQKIADTLKRFAGLLGDIKSAAAKKNTTLVQQLFVQIQSAGRGAAQASTDLKQKGYDIGAFNE
jgi:phage-related protein